MEKNEEHALRHIAVIMDGNGRWAERHGVKRAEGHLAGAQRVVDFIGYIHELEVKYVTLYAFSTENWKRSQEEVSALMDILCDFLDSNLETMLEKKIRLLASGRIEAFPEKCRVRLENVMRRTAENYDYTLILALNYGGRAEILDAVRKIAEEAVSGRLSKPEIEALDEQAFADRLYTPGVPDPDLMIRTSGEQRLSNFLLWQLSYSELYFTDVLWPDFDFNELKKAVDSFNNRKRRFGGRA